MAQNHTPSKTKPKATKTKGGDSQKEQSARFIEAARTLGTDETGKYFIDAVDNLLPKKKKWDQ